MRLRAFLLLAFGLAPLTAATVSPLAARGYSAMPEPQSVKLGERDFTVPPDWKLEGAAVSAIAVETLTEEGLRFNSNAQSVLRLVVAPDSARVGAAQDRDRAELARQAYRIDIAASRVTISANAPQGLFYGAATLIQLIRSRGALPEGVIEDWPDLQLRQIYWDDAHHLDRLPALKAAVRQAALFKLNGFALKLEGHFVFKSAPAVVEPHAMTAAEYQDLTDYALRYHVQLIPFLDSPGHIAFILKHPAYAALRAFPDSNYELCVTNPDSYKLIHRMFQDLLDANKGGKYFYLSTDEAYYIGLADNAGCREASRAKELGSVGKLLGEFLHKSAGYLRDRGRTVIFWGEYPLKPADIASLPPYLVNGETYGPAFDVTFKKHGIREMIYTSTQGEEKLFPDYFPPRGVNRRVYETFFKVTHESARRDADLMGVMSAAWADAGLHPETFWLGYACAASVAWHPGSPDPAESMAAFFPLHYGPRTVGLDRAYQLLSAQARFWTESWESALLKFRKPIWGNSNGQFQPPRAARDQFLPLPPAPTAELAYESKWAAESASRVERASAYLSENDELQALLHANLARADRNRYSIEVLESMARLSRQNLEMIAGIARMDTLLTDAAAKRKTPAEAVKLMDQALLQARLIRYQRNRALADTTETWYKTWFPRVAEANGRKFLHDLDDVKDHLPDRTVDMTYLIHRQLILPFGEWVESIRAARNSYAAAHGLGQAAEAFDWRDLKPVLAPAVGEISLE